MQESIQSYKDLIVWKKSVDLTLLIYRLTDTFPSREAFGLSSQMRRAAVSIPSNIAEGRRRGTTKDFMHFLRIAHGSLAELETQMVISRRLSYADDESTAHITSMATEVGKMLHAMIKKLG